MAQKRVWPEDRGAVSKERFWSGIAVWLTFIGVLAVV